MTDGETAAQYERTLILGYPVPEVDPDATGSFISSDPDAAPRWRHFLGVLDGAAVATGSAFVDEHHVHVEFISTLAARAAAAWATRSPPTRRSPIPSCRHC